MKLLLDENLSHRLVKSLSDLYPDSSHVRDCSLKNADDATVWAYAKSNDMVIVSKDSDFKERALLEGPPAKFIWVRLGNCSTQDIEALLRNYSVIIHDFHTDPGESLLVIP
jgi:predicted nuclease of predicted toxin-antitoxin system